MKASLILKNIIARKRRKKVTLGIFGEVGAGKTTLANLLSEMATGRKIGNVTGIPHETRNVVKVENIKLNVDEYELDLTLMDTPGVATYIDYREFMKHGLSKEESLERAREAAKGVIEALKHLDQVDVAIIVVDSTRVPFDQVNMVLVGNLEMRKIPFVIAANKIDRKDANPEMVRELFKDKPVVPISALKRINIENMLERVVQIA